MIGRAPADHIWLITAAALYYVIVAVFVVLVARDIIGFLKRKK